MSFYYPYTSTSRLLQLPLEILSLIITNVVENTPQPPQAHTYPASAQPTSSIEPYTPRSVTRALILLSLVHPTLAILCGPRLFRNLTIEISPRPRHIKTLQQLHRILTTVPVLDRYVKKLKWVFEKPVAMHLLAQARGSTTTTTTYTTSMDWESRMNSNSNKISAVTPIDISIIQPFINLPNLETLEIYCGKSRTIEYDVSMLGTGEWWSATLRPTYCPCYLAEKRQAHRGLSSTSAALSVLTTSTVPREFNLYTLFTSYLTANPQSLSPRSLNININTRPASTKSLTTLVLTNIEFLPLSPILLIPSLESVSFTKCQCFIDITIPTGPSSTNLDSDSIHKNQLELAPAVPAETYFDHETQSFKPNNVKHFTAFHSSITIRDIRFPKSNRPLSEEFSRTAESPSPSSSPSSSSPDPSSSYSADNIYSPIPTLAFILKDIETLHLQEFSYHDAYTRSDSEAWRMEGTDAIRIGGGRASIRRDDHRHTSDDHNAVEGFSYVNLRELTFDGAVYFDLLLGTGVREVEGGAPVPIANGIDIGSIAGTHSNPFPCLHKVTLHPTSSYAPNDLHMIYQYLHRIKVFQIGNPSNPITPTSLSQFELPILATNCKKSLNSLDIHISEDDHAPETITEIGNTLTALVQPQPGHGHAGTPTTAAMNIGIKNVSINMTLQVSSISSLSNEAMLIAFRWLSWGLHGVVNSVKEGRAHRLRLENVAVNIGIVWMYEDGEVDGGGDDEEDFDLGTDMDMDMDMDMDVEDREWEDLDDLEEGCGVYGYDGYGDVGELKSEKIRSGWDYDFDYNQGDEGNGGGMPEREVDIWSAWGSRSSSSPSSEPSPWDYSPESTLASTSTSTSASASASASASVTPPPPPLISASSSSSVQLPRSSRYRYMNPYTRITRRINRNRNRNPPPAAQGGINTPTDEELKALVEDHLYFYLGPDRFLLRIDVSVRRERKGYF